MGARAGAAIAVSSAIAALVLTSATAYGQSYGPRRETTSSTAAAPVETTSSTVEDTTDTSADDGTDTTDTSADDPSTNDTSTEETTPEQLANETDDPDATTDGDLQVDDVTPTDGQSLEVSACCFEPGSEVEISIDGVIVGYGIADANGAVKVTITIPPGTPVGPHTLKASGKDDDGNTIEVVAGRIVVIAPGGSIDDPDGDGVSGGLPRTGGGSHALDLAQLAAVLVAVGISLVIVAATRRADNVEA